MKLTSTRKVELIDSSLTHETLSIVLTFDRKTRFKIPFAFGLENEKMCNKLQNEIDAQKGMDLEDFKNWILSKVDEYKPYMYNFKKNA